MILPKLAVSALALALVGAADLLVADRCGAPEEPAVRFEARGATYYVTATGETGFEETNGHAGLQSEAGACRGLVRAARSYAPDAPLLP